MPQPEAACGSEGDGDSQPALSDTQSEPSSEELSVEAATMSTPTASPSSHKPKRRSASTTTPPAPLVNPLQFIKVKPPTHLYTSAPVQKPVVERIRKEEPEDWQNDLDGWKANRRKRQEQLMERVSEFKKSDSEPNQGSRKSKTFSEMMKRGRKHSLLVYDDDNEINFSELSLGTSSNNNKEQQQSAEALMNKLVEERVDEPINNNLLVESNNRTQVTEETIQVTTFAEQKSETPKAQEYTYEKAIQSYADFASSRVGKPKANDAAPVAASTAKDTFAATAVREVKVVTETIIVDDMMDEFLEAEDDEQSQLEPPPQPRQAPIIKSSVVKRISTPKVVDTFSYNNNNVNFGVDMDFIKLKHEPVLLTSSVGGGARPREIDARPITDKISQFEKSIEHSVLHNPPPPKKLRPPVPCKPPKSAPPPPPVSAAPTLVSTRELTLVSNLDAEEQESAASSAPLSPLSPALSCAELPDSASRPPHLPRPLSPRDRSPLGGEDSGVHTADSVSQSDEVDDDDPTAPLSLTSDLLGMINAPIVDHELSALLAPPTKMEPPREKPPPPPPVGAADDTEIMRKCFLGLEITRSVPMVPPPVPPPVLPPPVIEKKDEVLSNQLKEKLLRLEEEKNNVINLEKKVAAERQQHQAVSEFNLSAQERLVAEREALRVEREALQVAKAKQQEAAKKLALRSLESVEIAPAAVAAATPPAVTTVATFEVSAAAAAGRETPPDAYHTAKSSPATGSPLRPRPLHHPDYANVPSDPSNPAHPSHLQQQQQHPPLRKAQSEEHVQKHERTYANQAFFQPPQPSLCSFETRRRNSSGTTKGYSSIYEDPYNYDKPAEPVVVMRKKGPPPPIKPTARHSTIGVGGGGGGTQQLQRNFSADSILESVDGDAAAPMPSRQEIGHRPTMQLSSSTSHLAAAGRQQPAAKSQRPRSSGGLGLANYHQHWLVQEAEHRRIQEQQQRQASSKQQPKHLPDAIIMSLTQRVHQRQSQLPQRSPPQRSPPQRAPIVSQPLAPSVDDKVLSVSGKKKCSHCSLELGRGAAMIIESLRLFYHIDCFKCCVCCVQLGDGLMGTDVRVRNGKLHCHSCYSSDDGVKFSCV